MDQAKADIFCKAVKIGIIKDPQWAERLDEPVPLWVLLEIVITLHDVLNPPHKPFD